MSKLKMDAVDASLLVLNTMAGFLLVGIGTFDLFGTSRDASTASIFIFDIAFQRNS